MKQLVPYERYSRQDAFRCFSDADDGVALCDGQWIEFPDAVVGMMRVARHEPEIHFCDAGRFHWYAEKPYQVSTEHAEYSAIPQSVLDARETGTPLHLFVQRADSDDFVYIGEMSPPGMYGSGRDGKFAEAMFDLRESLPSGVWASVGGLYLHPDGNRELDRILQLIASATTPTDRFAAWQALVQFWRGPVAPEEGLSGRKVSRSSVEIPEVLRWFYKWAGNCRDLMNMGYYHFEKPDELEVRDRMVRFCVECQWVLNFAIRTDDLSQSDPLVCDDEGKGPNMRDVTLSEFLIQFFITHAVMSGPYRRRYRVSRAACRALEEVLRPMSIAPFEFFGRLRLLAGDGILATVRQESRRGSETWIEAAAKRETDLDALESRTGLDAIAD